MTAYQFMPSLSDSAYGALRESIAENGVQVPVVVDENGEIIDGHHRARAAGELEIAYPVDRREGLTETQKRDLAFSLNTNRRELTREQKRELVKISLREDPGLSDRAHGRRCCVSAQTVKPIRDELVKTAQLEQFPSGKGGRSKTRREEPAGGSESSDPEPGGSQQQKPAESQGDAGGQGEM